MHMHRYSLRQPHPIPTKNPREHERHAKIFTQLLARVQTGKWYVVKGVEFAGDPYRHQRYSHVRGDAKISESLLYVQRPMLVGHQFFDASHHQNNGVPFPQGFFYKMLGRGNEPPRPSQPSEHGDVKQHWRDRKHGVLRAEVVDDHATAEYAVRMAYQQLWTSVVVARHRPRSKPLVHWDGRHEPAPDTVSDNHVLV